MLEPGYLLVLVAAAAHAGWNTLMKRSADPLLVLTGIRLTGTVIGLLLAARCPLPPAAAIPFLAGNVAFQLAYYYCLVQSYRMADLSFVYPIARGLAPIAVLLLTAVFQWDDLATSQLIGTALGGAGITLFAAETASRQRRGFGHAVATGLSIAGYTSLAGLGVRVSGSPLGYLAWTEILAGVIVVPVVWATRPRRFGHFLSDNWRMLVGAGTLSVGGFGIALWAFQTLPLAPVAAIRESSVAFATLSGAWFLGERVRAMRAAAVTLVLAGIVGIVMT